MNGARLDVIGLLNIYPNLFSGIRDISVRIDPDNEGPAVYYETLSKAKIVKGICMGCKELGLLYPSGPYMEQLISYWWDEKENKFIKMLTSENYIYNPINNYDRTETENLEETGNETETTNATGNETRDLTNGRDITETLTDTSGVTESTSGATNNSAKRYVNGFNNSAFSPSDNNLAEQNDTNGDNTTQHTADTTQTGTRHNTGDETEKGTVRTTNEDSKTGTHTITHKRNIRAYGNIGVTTTQQMIESERQIIDFCTIDYIAESFKKEFCIMVY